MNGVALAVFVFFFGLVTVLGFVAARWRSADLGHLNEWGLGGRSFGTIITWFLLGGDLYTAYTFIAVPALVFGVGALGFFALPYTIIVYPFVFLVMPRLWSVAHKHQYVTPSDFVRGRYGSRGLSLAVASTGILATMPYIALQLVGIQVVLEGMGIGGSGASTLERDLPLFIAFAILAAYTYQSGLRAPALIAFVKDTMIYITVLVAIVYIPAKLGGWGHIFDAAGQALPHHSPPGSLILATSSLSPISPWPSAPPWRCSCTRTRSRRCCRRATATWSGATPPSCPPTASCSGCWPCSASWPSRPGSSRPPTTWRSPSCSTGCSPTGSSASPSPPSPSARWCQRRSCRSRRRTCSPATSTANGCDRTPPPG
jgi:hypothetical protein